MKKLGMIAFFLLLLFLLPPPPVWAEGSAVDVGAVEEALDEEAREIGGELKTDGSYDLDGALARLWARAPTGPSNRRTSCSCGTTRAWRRAPSSWAGR